MLTVYNGSPAKKDAISRNVKEISPKHPVTEYRLRKRSQENVDKFLVDRQDCCGVE
mgnify:CR=1 FL=1